MKTVAKKTDLKQKLIDHFEKYRKDIFQNDTSYISEVRTRAFNRFKEVGFPTSAEERWRNTDLGKTLKHHYEFVNAPSNELIDVDKVLRCEVPDFDTELISLYNGWYLSKNGLLLKQANGTIIGSLAKALKEYPELVEKYLTLCSNENRNGLDVLNTALAQDGIFIYVPDGVHVDKTIQMVNMINLEEKLFVQNRNLIIIGKDSHLRLVHCDDSLNHQVSFSNTLTEIFLEENASIDHYKLQNINDNSTLISSTYFYQENNSRISTNAIVLNGGLIRNDVHVNINGTNCDANIYGLYLVDKEQHVDNQVYIDHLKPHSISNELFKGIIDDQAKAVFNGHVKVHKDAQKTNAFQINKNILLTDKAVVNTKPFLEIYADDVKCSHGATVGQLDANAMFYIRSRGISEENARMLLMYAFAAEVINKIAIQALRYRIDDLVKKRLRGELSVCDQCVLNCRTKENTVSFEIDMTKI